LHWITNVVEPAGGAPGTLTVDPPITVANAVLRIPFNSQPHAYNVAVDGYQTYSMNPAQNHLNGPALFVSETAQRANGTHDFVIQTLGYSFAGVQIVWSTAASTRTFSWSVFGKIDNGAWPAAGAARAPYLANNWFQTLPGGTGWGGAGVTGGTLVSRTESRLPFREILIQLTSAATDANSTVLNGWVDLYGGAR